MKAVICSLLNSVIFTACDCSSPLQEIGRAIGIALIKQCGWRADLRDPDLEVVVFVCQVARCCFQTCPQYLLCCFLLPLHAGLWPLAVCLSAAEFNKKSTGSAEQSFLVATVRVLSRALK